MVAWKEQFINVNQYSRPATKLTAVRKLILHWTANNGGTAQNHYAYFGKTIIDAKRYASAHIFVDKTEAINIIPLNEVAYAANDVQKRNADGTPWRGVKELLPNANFLSVSVEMCVEKDGTIHPDTISRTVDVFADLCKKFNLDPINDIVTHNMVTAKNCPAPFIANNQLFIDFKNRVKEKLNPSGWQKKQDKWFYFGKTGWLLYKNSWYYIDTNNQMHEGWIQLNNKWYYLDPKQEGKMCIGWFQDDKPRWFFSNEKGEMLTGWVGTDKKFYLAANGAMVSGGWQCIDGKWYCFGEDGHLMTNEDITNATIKVNADGSISQIK
jgi:N-acetylmuramoyl-L-alanine amidase